MMHARRGHQMAEIVELEVVSVLERFGAGLALAGPHEHLSMQVAVFALRAGNRIHDFIDGVAQTDISGGGERRACGSSHL